jgi:hypothetical protein
MTSANALSLCVKLKRNFQRTTEELLEEWHDRFLAFDYAVGHRVVETYVTRYDELRTNALLSLLRDGTHKAAAPRAADRELERRTEAEWSKIDAVIDEMSDNVLAEHRRAAIDGLPEQSRAVLGRSNPRKSRVLKSLIAVRMGLGAPYVDGSTGERIHRN